MPKYKYPLANGKHLVVDGDVEPDDTELESLAKEQGVQLKVDDGFKQEAPVDTSIPKSLAVPFKQENQYTPPPTPSKTGISRGWELLNKPVTDYLPPEWQPGNIARKASDWITEPSANPDSLWESSPRLRGFVGGTLEGIGDFAAGITSPINVATAVASGGAGLAAKAGLTNLARVARGAETVAGGAMVGHGGSEVIRPDATLEERAQGLFELAGGGGAIHHGLSGPPVIKPKVPVTESLPYAPEPPVGSSPEVIKRWQDQRDLANLENVEKWQLEKEAQQDADFLSGKRAPLPAPGEVGAIRPYAPDTSGAQFGPVTEEISNRALSDIAAKARGRRIAASLPAEETHPFGDVTDFTPIKPRITAAQAAANLRAGRGLQSPDPNLNAGEGDPMLAGSAPMSRESAIPIEQPLKWGDDPQRNRQFRQEYQRHVQESQQQGRPPLSAKEFQIFEADDLMDDFMGSQRKGPVPDGEPFYGPDGEIIGYTTDTNGSTGIRMLDTPIPKKQIIPDEADDFQSVRGTFSNETNPDIRVDVLRGLEPENGRVPHSLQRTGQSEFGSTFSLADLPDSKVLQRGLEQRLESLPPNSPEATALIRQIEDLPHNRGMREFSNQVIPDEAADWQSDPNRERKYGNKFGRGRAVPEVIPQEQGLQRFSNQVVDDGRVLTPELTDAGAPPLPKVYDESNPNINFTKDIDRMQRERISKDNDPRLQAERDARIAQNRQQSETQAALNINEGDFRVSNELNAARIPLDQLTPEQAAIKASYDNIRAHDDVYGRKFSEAEELLPEGEFYKPPREVAARHKAEQDALKDTHYKLVDEYKQNQQFADQVVPEPNILKPRRMDPKIVDVEPTLANKRPEGVTVKKSKDFLSSGNWEVKLANGKTEKIYRDPESGNWYIDNLEQHNRNPSLGRPRTTAFSKNEMIQKLQDDYGSPREQSTNARPDEANDSPDRPPSGKNYEPNPEKASTVRRFDVATAKKRHFLFNPKTNEFVLGKELPEGHHVDDFTHAETFAEAGRNSKEYDSFGVKGFLKNGEIEITGLPYEARHSGVMQSDLRYALTQKLKQSGGATPNTLMAMGYEPRPIKDFEKFEARESSNKLPPEEAYDTGAQSGPESTSKPAVPLKDSIVVPHGQRTNTLINEMRAKGFKFAGQDVKGDSVFHKSDDPIPVSTNAVPIVRYMKEHKHPEAGMIREIWNAPRSMMSIDLPFISSAALRQGLPLVGTKSWFQAWGPSMKSYGSKKFYDAHSALIQADPLMQRSMRPVLTSQGKPLIQGGRPVLKEMPSIMEQAGVALNDLSSFTDREELIRSSLPEKWGIYGKMVAANNRAYSAFINDLRIGTFRNFYDAMPDKNDMVALKQLGDAVGTFTGRGRLATKIPFTMDPKTGTHRMMTMERHAGALAEVLFAPRLVASRLQMLNPVNYTPMMKPQVRKEYLKKFIKTATAWGTMAGALNLIPGSELSLDPFSADFMKPKIGKLRLDPAGGIQQFLVLGARMASNKFTSSTTGETFELGKGFGAQTKGDVIQNFISNKFQPWVKAFYDAAFASERRPFNLFDRAIQMAVPMMTSDMIEIAKEEPELIPWLAPLVSAGVGSQYYSAKEPYGKSKIYGPTLGMMGVKKPEDWDITLGR